MTAESYPIARFDHVTKTGSLVFAANGSHFTVELDETLERAILEAKQVRAEMHDDAPAQPQRTLPISQIQALIRAGVDPEQVARRYELNPALVRRFAAPVASEKNYAIEQFLRVPAPKEARVHSLAELIERTLAAARIPRESVRWKATRRGLEPWRITASFESAGHPIHAEWSWNMHDNTVVCVNNAARKLIGETGASPLMGGEQDEALNEAFPTSVQLPGDSARSARIEIAMAQWHAKDGGEGDSGAPAADPASAGAHDQGSDGNRVEESSTQDEDAPDTQDIPQVGEDAAPADDATNSAKDAPGKVDATPADIKPRPHASHGHRSPIPSWDEIMFGKDPKR